MTLKKSRSLLIKRRSKRVHMKMRRHAINFSKLRIVVHRSNRNLFVQVIDDLSGRVCLSLGSLSGDVIKVFGKNVNRSNKNVAQFIGKRIGSEMLNKNIVTGVVFDKGPYHFCGVIKELADAIKSCGVVF
jgi:large subunit ribosomal protein L18